jgi:hypothetical protein
MEGRKATALYDEAARRPLKTFTNGRVPSKEAATVKSIRCAKAENPLRSNQGFNSVRIN